MDTKEKFQISGSTTVTHGKLKDRMWPMKSDSMVNQESKVLVRPKELNGKIAKELLLWLTILQFQDSIPTIQTIWDFGDQDPKKILILTLLTKVITKVLSKKDKKLNTSQVFYIPTIPQMQVKNSDWSNSISSVPQVYMISLEDIKRIMITLINFQPKTKFNSMILTQL